MVEKLTHSTVPVRLGAFLSDCFVMMQAWGLQAHWVTVQGSDRWQPPDIPNADEVLIRPEPVEEKAEEQDQQAPQRAVNHLEPISASAAAPVDDTVVQQDVGAQEKTQTEQHRHRQRFDSLYLCRL